MEKLPEYQMFSSFLQRLISEDICIASARHYTHRNFYVRWQRNNSLKLHCHRSIIVRVLKRIKMFASIFCKWVDLINTEKFLILRQDSVWLVFPDVYDHHYLNMLALDDFEYFLALD